MNYLLLIYEAESELAVAGSRPADFMDQYRRFTGEIVGSGEFVAGDELQPTSTATSVRVRNGEILLTDGPFAETAEQLGGYYLIKAENLDRAIAIAAKIPSAAYGTIEVRPVTIWEG